MGAETRAEGREGPEPREIGLRAGLVPERKDPVKEREFA